MLGRIPEIIMKVREKIKEKYGIKSPYSKLLSLGYYTVYVIENKKTKQMELDRIEFLCYDKIIISKDRVVYYPEYRHDEVLLCYNDWNGLLSL